MFIESKNPIYTRGTCGRRLRPLPFSPHRRLALYSYFAEAEGEFIALRTKQGMAAARAKGVKIGRPKGSWDKLRMLDPYREQIKEYLRLTLPLRRICALINPQLSRPLTYPAYRYFVRQDGELLALWQGHRREQ